MSPTNYVGISINIRMVMIFLTVIFQKNSIQIKKLYISLLFLIKFEIKIKKGLFGGKGEIVD